MIPDAVRGHGRRRTMAFGCGALVGGISDNLLDDQFTCGTEDCSARGRTGRNYTESSQIKGCSLLAEPTPDVLV